MCFHQHRRGIVVGNGQLKNIQILILFFPLTHCFAPGQPAWLASLLMIICTPLSPLRSSSFAPLFVDSSEMRAKTRRWPPPPSAKRTRLMRCVIQPLPHCVVSLPLCLLLYLNSPLLVIVHRKTHSPGMLGRWFPETSTVWCACPIPILCQKKLPTGPDIVAVHTRSSQ